MKKFLLFALVAMIGMPVLAQDEIGDDVTKYIANAGFDEDLTFQKDGTMKEAISTTTSLSERSWAYIAADSTCMLARRQRVARAVLTAVSWKP